MSDLSGFIWAHFSNFLPHFLLISPKREIDEKVNFRKFRKLFTNKLPAFLWHFGTLFQMRKTKEISDKAHEACCGRLVAIHL